MGQPSKFLLRVVDAPLALLTDGVPPWWVAVFVLRGVLFQQLYGIRFLALTLPVSYVLFFRGGYACLKNAVRDR